ncbi:uncharacterized protein LOC124493474 [Dermatophagoides farinae]|uniref:uncharacterized protein LOC124493474 n=1 Tax=Dermatophagoides farinae TaxID=6954 RepID=UPI003F631786
MQSPSLASSYDPLYPLRTRWWICKSIYDLFDIQIHQFMLQVFGPLETFHILQNRLEKLNISDQLFVPLGVYAVFVLIDGIDHLIEFVRHELINASILEGINFSDGDNPTNDLLDVD